jgi:bifunctional non-homologous end joining protein LigD
MTSGLVQVGKRTLKLTNLDKVLYPESDFTKGQVVDYYRRIAAVLIPHLKDRPLTLKRYPNGVGDPFFYEKRCPSHKPDWVRTAHIWSDSNNDFVDYCLVNDVPTLMWVANLASIELHTLLSRHKTPTRPTMMVFDFDPGPPAGLAECIPVALRMRDVLAHLNLQSFIKTSGGKGLHLYVPLNTPRTTFDQTKSTSRAFAQLLERDDPKRITTVMRRDLRPGKVFIDWSQNDAHKTTACVYTLRALPRPTVSAPLAWEELEEIRTPKQAQRLTFETPDVLRRVDEIGDLFAPLETLKQRLPALA